MIKSVILICIGMVITPIAFAHMGLDHQIEEVTKQIQTKPQDASLWLKRARLYRLHRNYQKAIEDIKMVKKMSPQNVEILLESAQVSLLTGENFGEATTDVSTYLKNFPKAWKGYEVRGDILSKQGKFTKAKKDFAKAASLYKEPHLYIKWAEACSSLGNKREEIEAYEKALKILGKSYVISGKLIQAYTDTQQVEKAISHIDALAKNPVMAIDWQIKKIEILMQSKQVQRYKKQQIQTLGILNTAIEKKGHPNLFLKRARLFALMQKKEEAEKDLSKLPKSYMHRPEVKKIRKQLNQ